VKIENFRESLPGTSIVATFDLYVPALQMTIHQCKVIRSKKGKLFPSLPSYGVSQPDGSKKFCSLITFSLEKQKEFDKSLSEVIAPFITNK
jgi:hypothetical protein